MDTFINDVRHAIRSLAKARLFTAVAVASLALGIGANVATFSIVNALAFKPLPYTEPDRLVDVSEWSATQLCADCGVGTSLDGFLDWKTRARSFSAMGVYLERSFNVSGTETAERIGGAVISAETFPLLGVVPALGRGFTADDDRAGAAPVALISDGLWNRRYGGDRRIVGQTIRINGTATTVVGVMPPKFGFPEFAQLWVPALQSAPVQRSRAERDYGVVARLAPGVSIAQAGAEMKSVAAAIEREHPETQKEWTATVSSFRTEFDAMPAGATFAALGAVAFVLLIVCANLAGLLLARGADRRREIAVRMALGASRGQIVRHLLVESLLLGCVGGAFGLLLASWCVDLVASQLGAQTPFYVQFGVDRVTLAYSIVVSLATGVLCGLLPALRSSRTDVHTVLKDSQIIAQRSHLRGMLVIAEMTLAMILLAGAGELVKSFLKLSAVSGAEADPHLLTGKVEFLDTKYRDASATRTALAAIADRLREVPGVRMVATHRADFIAGFGGTPQEIRVDGMSSLPAGVSPSFYHIVSPDYFAINRSRMVSGRAFSSADRAGSPLVTIITEGMARTLWPGQTALGHRIKLGSADSLQWLTIVGVVADASRGGRIRSYAYVPADQAPGSQADLLIRSDADPLPLIPLVRAAVRSIDADLPVLDLRTARDAHRAEYMPYRIYAAAMSGLAVFAILLAALGLYGVIAYNTAQRTREIGIRMALGAVSSDVVKLIARQGGRLVGIGIVAGTLGASLLLRVLQSALFGASPVDFPVFAGVAVLLAGIALVAIWIPARRAVRIDPLVALRAE
jgi:predicted permease